ncbi:MAG: hypothetical protein Ct9H300mP3_01540 [Gammaproteobacteria bacterium]|nr:MAG: hypothetical protein Ct9H300mP3_01540 [Gammaproteobacteria bacterium]
MRMPKPPFNFIDQNDFPKSHAPVLGQHNREVLSELSVDEEDITRMEAREKANKEIIEGMLLRCCQCFQRVNKFSVNVKIKMYIKKNHD